MGAYVTTQVVKAMLQRRIQVNGAKVLVLGLAFKENCPDLRNTRVVDIVDEFKGYGVEVDVHDPWVDHDEAQAEYGLTLTKTPEAASYDAIILAVAHDEFVQAGISKLHALGRKDHVLYDLKSVFPAADSDLRL